jgi:alpha-beta hydrolase superfamily lysophospholipase
VNERRPEPVAFGSTDRLLFGWVHHPPERVVAKSVGLLICKPFGYEAICAHRSLRHFADAAAGAGVSTLRFDYDGTGDSAGSDTDPDRWRSWVQSVHRAAEELKRHARVDRLCLLGIRLGATLAACAAVERDDIIGLAAVAPVTKGAAWLREVHALEQAMGFAGPPPGPEPPSSRESVGFVITDDTAAVIRALDLLTLARPPARDVLIVDRAELPSAARWAERLTETGAHSEYRQMRGYREMMLDPHEAAVPVEIIGSFVEWLRERTTNIPPRQVSPPPRQSKAGPVLVAPGVVETIGYLDDTNDVVGVVTAPADRSRSARGIMLLNSGAIVHIGPSRLYVDLARRWASQGFVVLRFDQPGLGDSLPFSGEQENVVYAPSAVAGVALANDFLRRDFGAHEVQAVGLCSGAYHALKAAVAQVPLRGVALVNPLVFFWKPGMSLAYPPYQVAEAAARYKRSVFQLDKWKKFFSGKVSLRAFAQVVVQRSLMRAGSIARDVARAVGKPMREDLGVELESIAERGVALSFVFAAGDPGEDLLRFQGGRSVRRLASQERLRIHRIEGPNHAFTPVWTRRVLEQVLEAELGLG